MSGGLQGSEQAFVRMREARGATLAPPKLLYPSIQMTMRAGQLPPPEADGRRYLRIWVGCVPRGTQNTPWKPPFNPSSATLPRRIKKDGFVF